MKKGKDGDLSIEERKEEDEEGRQGRNINYLLCAKDSCFSLIQRLFWLSPACSKRCTSKVSTS